MNPKYLRGWTTSFTLLLLVAVVVVGTVPWVVMMIAGAWYDTKWPRVSGPESGVPR